MSKIWIGSPTDVRLQTDAEEALSEVSDAKYWNDETGITEIDHERWQKAQAFESEGWTIHWRDHTSDRDHEHIAGFGNYATVPQDLGDVLEIGCGPFTQLKTIQEGRTINSVTLLDPLIEKYLQLPNCSYKSGKLMEHPTMLYAKPAEDLRNVEEFDTAICVNVLEHVQSVSQILTSLANSLRPGGTLIFGERVYDKLDINEVYDVGHPIRPKMKVFSEWEKQFIQLYCKNTKPKDPLRHEHYFIGVKNVKDSE